MTKLTLTAAALALAACSSGLVVGLGYFIHNYEQGNENE